MTVFISHSHEDKAIYSTLCMLLDSKGIDRFDVSKMTLGKPLASELLNAIKECSRCVFIATPRSIKSQWCLAELGAFWGAGKSVIIFMADPGLDESVLPGQFRGNLQAHDADRVISALHEPDDISDGTQSDIEFFETSGNYGKEEDWQRLLHNATNHFDVLGVALTRWRQTPGFKDTVLTKAAAGCAVRILLMHPDNEILGRLLYNNRDLSSVQRDINESYSYYSSLCDSQPQVEVRQIRQGIPHFFLTRNDECSVIIQYLSSAIWGSGPTWRCPAQSALHFVAIREFEHLWSVGTKRITNA